MAQPRQIGDVLAQLIARRGYAREQSTAALPTAWREAAGEQFAAVTRAGNAAAAARWRCSWPTTCWCRNSAFRKTSCIAKLRTTGCPTKRSTTCASASAASVEPRIDLHNETYYQLQSNQKWPTKPQKPSTPHVPAAATRKVHRRQTCSTCPTWSTSASGRACTSAIPPSAACTTWSTKSSTTRSTRPWPATPSNVRVTINNDGSVTVEDDGRGIPVEKHDQLSRGPGPRCLHARRRDDRAQVRRQVQQGRLSNLRRLARRRRHRRQLPLRMVRGRSLAATATSISRNTNAACRTGPVRRIGTTDQDAAPRPPSSPTRRSFQTTKFVYDTLLHAACRSWRS